MNKFTQNDVSCEKINFNNEQYFLNPTNNDLYSIKNNAYVGTINKFKNIIFGQNY